MENMQLEPVGRGPVQGHRELWVCFYGSILVGSSRSISVAVPLGCVLCSEVGGGGSSRRHMSVRRAVLHGEAGLAWELMSLGHHTAGLSADCWCFLFKPKSSWSQSPLGSKPCLYTCCASLLVFTSSNFQAPASAWHIAFLTALQHLKELLCWSWCAISSVAGARASSRPGCQTPEDAVWGWVAGGPS